MGRTVRFVIPAVPALMTLAAVSCGNNPEGPDAWPDGAEFMIGSPDPCSDTALAFSPGGEILLFCSDYSGNPGIYGFEVGSGDDPSLRTFMSQDESNGPNGCWCDTVSASGTGMIVFTARFEEGFSSILWMPGNEYAVHTLVNDSLPHLHPSWSPDADSLVWSTMQDGSWGIWTSAFDSIAPVPLYSPAGVDCLRPSYSPDGDWIIFERIVSGEGDIWAMRPDGSEAHELAGGPGDDRHPCWGHGDGRFAFTSDRTGNHEIWIGETGSSDLVQVTFDEADDLYPAWNPSGDWIAFSSDRQYPGESYDVYWIDAPVTD